MPPNDILKGKIKKKYEGHDSFNFAWNTLYTVHNVTYFANSTQIFYTLNKYIIISELFWTLTRSA